MPPPDLEARFEIFRVHTRDMTLDPDVDLKRLAEDTELFTGAELKAICNEAGIVALREDISSSIVCNRHFMKVMESVKPALTREEIDSYASFAKNPSPKSRSKNYNEQDVKNIVPSLRTPVTTVGAVSLMLYACIKYLFTSSNKPPSLLPTT